MSQTHTTPLSRVLRLSRPFQSIAKRSRPNLHHSGQSRDQVHLLREAIARTELSLSHFLLCANLFDPRTTQSAAEKYAIDAAQQRISGLFALCARATSSLVCAIIPMRIMFPLDTFRPKEFAPTCIKCKYLCTSQQNSTAAQHLGDYVRACAREYAKHVPATVCLHMFVVPAARAQPFRTFLRVLCGASIMCEN